MKAIDVVVASLDPKDDPKKPPRQSVSEQQVPAKISPIHGLKVWDGLLRQVIQTLFNRERDLHIISFSRYFGKRSIKAANGKAESIAPMAKTVEPTKYNC